MAPATTSNQIKKKKFSLKFTHPQKKIFLQSLMLHAFLVRTNGWIKGKKIDKKEGGYD